VGPTDRDGGADGSPGSAGRPPGDEIVDWAVARRTGEWLSGRSALPEGYDVAPLQQDFDRFLPHAEELVEAATGLRPPSGPARGRVASRPEWAAANVASFQRLLGSTLDRLAERRSPVSLRNVRAFAEASRKTSGAQLGLLLAWMSSRVLGQYDILLTDPAAAGGEGAPGHSPDEDMVYFVGPNVVQLEQRHGFAPEEFRLWLTIHEVTHRAQFTAVPWLRGHFLSLVERGIEPFAADPSRLVQSIRRAATDIRSGRNPMAEAGAVGLLATPEQMEAIRSVQALMSLLEGHGDVVMDRAGADEVPSADHFGKVLADRRAQVRGPVRLLQQVLGLEAKMRQYAEGERFVRAVEAAGGRALFDEVWADPSHLPSMEEIRLPARWIGRMRPGLPAAG